MRPHWWSDRLTTNCKSPWSLQRTVAGGCREFYRLLRPFKEAVLREKFLTSYDPLVLKERVQSFLTELSIVANRIWRSLGFETCNFSMIDSSRAQANGTLVANAGETKELSDVFRGINIAKLKGVKQ